MKKVGVIGCGLMGRGIVEVCARAGLPVVVSEISQELLDKGMEALTTSLTKAAGRGQMSEVDRDKAISLITGTTDMNGFKDCDIVIEAAVENMGLKKKIFVELDKICKPEAILSTNTSCLSVIDLAAQTGRPEKVLGMHFFNPVPMMKLLEMVRTIETSDETMDVCRAFGEAIGKSAVVSSDTPGFIVNRLLIPLLLEAVKLLESGSATIEDIDKAVKLGLNHPMGPFQLADLIGLDTCYFICDAMYEDMKEQRFAPPIMLKKKVAAKQYGRKSGKGFYNYKTA
ncbi:MAG: 3-hydroxybutyryl-CoA dehydrogenase [Dehalococcoidia bacterium]|nr:3-hydroxybutyryl-CoA dehydrogenase [Dehalococcoidia bacterium]